MYSDTQGDFHLYASFYGQFISHYSLLYFTTVENSTGKWDFGRRERVARFAPGDYEPKCIDIPIWDDDTLEERETFYVQIRNLTERVYNIFLENVVIYVVDNDSEW